MSKVSGLFVSVYLITTTVVVRSGDDTAISHKVAGLNIPLYLHLDTNDIRHTYSLNIIRTLTLNIILNYVTNANIDVVLAFHLAKHI